MSLRRLTYLGAVLLLAALVAGCGGGGEATETSGGKSASSESTPRSQSGGTGKGASAAAETEAPSEAQSAATGDIPDNQVFLTFTDRPAGYSVRYPEGWARRGSGADVTFQEKGNVIHIVVAKGSPPTPASATASLERLKRSDPTVRAGKPELLEIAGAPVIKVTYTRLSAPDPVTGKRLPLTIDRYMYARHGKVAVIDLGTPVGVDNVDAYRMISRSFRWR